MTPITISFYLSHAIAFWLFIIACSFAFFRVDDLIFDTMFLALWFRRWCSRKHRAVFAAESLEGEAQKRIAIFVPCWHEDDVVEHMIETALKNIDYERFDLFVGVYPNDPPTVEKVLAASRKFPNVHAVINEKDGPTTKAQNLNCVYRAMERIEGDDPFEIILLHDVEDVIHPLELRLHNHLLPQNDMVQTPVFPLERPLHKLLGWTYADEFARNHLKDMFVREGIGAFVPSAGVGTAFSRTALERLSLSGQYVFPEGSLTEDYLLALRLHRSGLRTIFVNQRLSPCRKGRAATAMAYVATREFFPDRFRTAVRQKARWVAGICLQAWSEIGWCGDFATRYALYRDRKGLLTNLLSLFGWVAIALAGAMYVWRAFDERVFVPAFDSGSATTILLDFVLLATLVELLQTACFTTWVYGPCSGAMSMVRAPLAAFVNGYATMRAIYVFAKARLSNRAMAWSKTQHEFPTQVVVARRPLGELLVEQANVTVENLERGLAEHRRVGTPLGETLMELGLLEEAQLLETLAHQTGMLTLQSSDVQCNAELARSFSRAELETLCAVPVQKTSAKVVVAASRMLEDSDIALLRERLGCDIVIRLASPRAVKRALFGMLTTINV
ncbi:MAG: phage adsorption protein NrfB [Candidatus Eremiobacteraeota bacterium]|nr:phage adsorption protein NrfB [Candidatus Eremiobacteraeota bacterium]